MPARHQVDPARMQTENLQTSNSCHVSICMNLHVTSDTMRAEMPGRTVRIGQEKQIDKTTIRAHKAPNNFWRMNAICFIPDVSPVMFKQHVVQHASSCKQCAHVANIIKH
jgi:aldehyde:ferredoxin oxidoreductase